MHPRLKKGKGQRGSKNLETRHRVGGQQDKGRRAQTKKRKLFHLPSSIQMSGLTTSFSFVGGLLVFAGICWCESCLFFTCSPVCRLPDPVPIPSQGRKSWQRLTGRTSFVKKQRWRRRIKMRQKGRGRKRTWIVEKRGVSQREGVSTCRVEDERSDRCPRCPHIHAIFERFVGRHDSQISIMLFRILPQYSPFPTSLWHETAQTLGTRVTLWGNKAGQGSVKRKGTG